MAIQLETTRLILRPFHESDLETFSNYRSDPAVARYQGWDVPYTMVSARIFLRYMENVQPGTVGEWFQFAVQRKSSGEMLGDIGLHVLKEDGRQAEFGVTFARQHHGQGYASEALSCIFDYVFDELKLNRIISRLDVRNLASAALMERLGMRREAHFLQCFWSKGEWTDEYWYAILAQEWQPRRTGQP